MALLNWRFGLTQMTTWRIEVAPSPRRGLSPKHRAASSGLPPCFGEVLQCVRDINVRPGQFRKLQPALIGSVQILSPGAPVLAHEPQKPAPSK